MGLGNSENTRATLLKLKTKKGEKPGLAKMEKVDDKWTETEFYDTISGVVTGLKAYDSEYEGEVSKKVKITMSDNGESFTIDSYMNNTSRNIINSLCGDYDKNEVVEISFYTKNDFASASVRLKSTGEFCPWATSWDDMPKPEEVTNKKGKVVSRDFSEVDAFFASLCDGFTGGKATTKTFEPEVAQSETLPAGVEAIESEEDDQLPF